MSSLFTRKGSRKLYAKVQNIDGVWKQIPTPFYEHQRAEAQAWVAELEKKVENERRARLGLSPVEIVTVASWAKEWNRSRIALEIDSNHDYPRLNRYVLPAIGDMPIADVHPKHLVELFTKIRTTRIKTAKGLDYPAPRTVYNIYSALTALFRDAQFAGHVAQTPCILTDMQLGSKVDKDRDWRKQAVFTRDEAQTLISTSQIPWDRRVAYALELLGGPRPGEVAVLRWRHYTAAMKPLGQIHIVDALNSKRGKIKGTKTESERFVPAHPTLAAILAEWKLRGWEQMMGRPPTPDDLIVPMPPWDAQARTKRAAAEPVRTYWYSGRRWREDLAKLGWRDRRHYDMRATFITLALDDGADEDIIESRVTHTKKSRSAFDSYNRGLQWSKTCAEVVKLKVFRVSPDGQNAETATMVAGGGDDLGAVDLGAVMVQSAKVAEMTDGLSLRRRVSNPSLRVVGAGPSQDNGEVTADEVAPRETGLHQTAPNEVKSPCDLGFALMVAAAVGSDS